MDEILICLIYYFLYSYIYLYQYICSHLGSMMPFAICCPSTCLRQSRQAVQAPFPSAILGGPPHGGGLPRASVLPCSLGEGGFHVCSHTYIETWGQGCRPLSSKRSGREGGGGLAPSKRPGRVPRPPTLVVKGGDL